MLRIHAPVNRRLIGPYRKDCVCGANLWENCLPSLYGLIICTKCGKDHSRNPGFRFRTRWAAYMLQKRARLFGLVGMWRQRNLPSLFKLPREIEMQKRQKAAQTKELEEDGILH